MRIEAAIDYWGDDVLTFDPEKVVVRLKSYFDEVVIDPKDYSYDELERFIKYADEKIEEPNRSKMIASMKGKSRTNGPAFKFKIPLENNVVVTGVAARYRVEFNCEQDFDAKVEKRIVEFLKSLKYGEIRSNTQTNLFGELSETFENHWLLSD